MKQEQTDTNATGVDAANEANKVKEAKLARQNRLKRLIIGLAPILFIAGVVSFAAYPEYFAEKTYMSENALAPGWRHMVYGDKDLNMASALSEEYRIFQSKLSGLSSEKWNTETVAWIRDAVRAHGLQVHSASFQWNSPNPLDSIRGSKTIRGENLVVVLREPRAPPGVDAVLMTARFDRANQTSPLSKKQAYSWALAVSMIKQLETQRWRSRDIVLVLSPGVYDGVGLDSWLSSYFSAVTDEASAAIFQSQSHHGQYSNIIAGLNIDIDVSHSAFDAIGIRAEGSYGNLPNLDLINTIVRVGMRSGSSNWATPAMGLDDSRVEWIPSMFDVVASFCFFFDEYGNVVEQLRPWWPELENLFTFMQNQAWGVPTGDHAYMSRYAINAVTLFNKRTNASKDSVGLDVIGRTVEGTMRSLMNLNEPLHQSFYFYLLPSPYNYVSIGIYMISFGLMVAGIAAHTLLLGLLAENEDVMYSVWHVAVAQFVGAVAFTIALVAPSALSRLPNNLSNIVLSHVTADGVMYGWVGIVFILELLTLFVVFPKLDGVFPLAGTHSATKSVGERRAERDETFRAFAVVPLLVFLPAFALVNFSFAASTTVVMIPLSALLVKARLRLAGKHMQLLCLMILSPISLAVWSPSFFGLESVASGLEGLISNYARHGQLLFPFLTLIYFPFSLLGRKLWFM